MCIRDSFCTVGYAPPEQLLGKKYLVGPASDLYSLGCLSYELACGAVPSKGTNLFTIISQQLAGWQPDFTFLFSVPAGFSEWLSALLSPEIAGRFRHAADALAALLELPPAVPSSFSAPDFSEREQEGMLSAPTQVFSADSVPTLRNDSPQDLNLSAKDLLNPWRPAISGESNAESGPLLSRPTGSTAQELSLIHISEPTRPY